MRESWPVEQLVRHVELISGQHIEASLCNEKGYGQPYLTGPSDFPDGTILVSKFTQFPKVACEAGDVLITVKGSGTGKTTIAERSYCISRQLMAVRPTSINGGYLHHVLAAQTERMRAEALGFIPGIGRSDVLSMPVGAPPLPEQRQIAEVLDTLDDAIRKTEEIIAKLKQVKQGLLHDLLTRGIDENGELRDPVRHPEQFKDSPLGRIPLAWEVEQLSSLLESIDAGWSPACVEEPPPIGSWGVLKVSAVTSGVFRNSESKTLPSGQVPRPELEVQSGDVLLARANGVAELVGVTVQVNEVQPRLMLSDKLLRLNPDSSRLTREFLATVMSSHRMRRQIAQRMSGSSGQKNISQDQIRSFLVSLPDAEEQSRIDAKLSAIDSWRAAEDSGLSKLRLIKKGLMEDLLTGKVRVTPLLDEAT